MAKRKESNEGFHQFISHIKNMLENMNEKEREEFKKVMTSKTGLAEVENEKFYTYQKPDYASKAAKEIDGQWLAPFWHVEPDDDKLELCEFVERDGQNMKMTRKQQREELRGYMYLLFSRFEPEQRENRWRLYGPLWMMERLKMTDCLDLVLEALRQDAYFFHNFFERYTEWPSAVVYQLGKDQLDTLEDFLYEQGIIPDAKPIVLNAIIWTYLRHPEKRLRVLAIITKFLNHCLDICKKGASKMNIEQYALALATAHIKETMPQLRRLFTELNVPTMILTGGADEFEQVMNDESVYYYCEYDSLDGFLRDEHAKYEADEDEFLLLEDEDEYWDEEDDGPYEFDDFGIYDTSEKAKRYTVRIELMDAPEKVERTLQLPSNMTLTGFAELIMLSFGWQDVPEKYEFKDDNLRYLPDADEQALGIDYREMDSTDYTTVGFILGKKGASATFDIKKGKKTQWHHVITLEKSGRYTPKSEEHIVLLSGQGSYPTQSIRSMAEYASRYEQGKLKKPNFDTIRKRLREFEQGNEPFCQSTDFDRG